MVYRFKTAKRTQEIFDKILNSKGLQPYSLAKLAIALSLECGNSLKNDDFHTNTNGQDLARQTIFGDYDTIFKSLIILKEGEPLTDEEYFPKYVKAHLDRGAILLEAEFLYNNNFIEHLANLDKGI